MGLAKGLVENGGGWAQPCTRYSSTAGTKLTSHVKLENNEYIYNSFIAIFISIHFIREMSNILLAIFYIGHFIHPAKWEDSNRGTSVYTSYQTEFGVLYFDV